MAQPEPHYLSKSLKNLLESIKLVAVVLDPQGHVTFANDYLLNLTGWKQEEVIGQNWLEKFLPPAKREAMATTFHTNINQESISPHYENPILTRQGEERLIAWNNTILRDAEGVVIGTASVGVDITDRKRMEEQLLQSQKMESIGRLAGGIAHDFNNFLTAIMGYTDLALSELPQNSPIAIYLSHARKASEQAAHLVMRLLTFARKQIISPVVLNLNQVLHDMEAILRPLLGNKIDLKVTTEADPALVRTDSGQLQQVLMNLIVNARDAMPWGGNLTIKTGNLLLSDYNGPKNSDTKTDQNKLDSKEP